MAPHSSAWPRWRPEGVSVEFGMLLDDRCSKRPPLPPSAPRESTEEKSELTSHPRLGLRSHSRMFWTRRLAKNGAIREFMTVRVQPSTRQDRAGIRDVLLNSGLFKASDAECVDEMFGLALAKPTPDNYRFLSGFLDDALVAFACFGWEYLTRGTWDLFWVCTLPAARGRGLGGALLSEAIRVASAEGGRLMVIYTSSTEAYGAAHRLYETHGFQHTATVQEYYNTGDDLHIYTRKLNARQA
jgi:ribosomal protein S18 acetylase RimI-like enzyme